MLPNVGFTGRLCALPRDMNSQLGDPINDADVPKDRNQSADPIRGVLVADAALRSAFPVTQASRGFVPLPDRCQNRALHFQRPQAVHRVHGLPRELCQDR